MASLIPREEKVLKGGKAEETREEKWVGERFRRLRRTETIGGEAEGSLASRTLNRMKKWSEKCKGVTIRLSVVQFRTMR